MSTRYLLDKALTQIAVVADELTEPSPHTERVRTGWTKSRNPVFTTHQVVLPGLLAQLYAAAMDPSQTGDSSGSKPPPPESKPPLPLEPLSTYSDICSGAMRWCNAIRVPARDYPQGNIRALVGASVRFDLDTAESLLLELRTWRRWCAVYTGWEQQVFRPRIPCPKCDSFSSIRVNGAKRLAFCSECQASWEGPDLVDMAEYVREHQAA